MKQQERTRPRSGTDDPSAETGDPSRDKSELAARIPSSAIAARLVDSVRQAGPEGVLFIAHSEAQAEEVSACFGLLLPEAQMILLPPWDCLPHDRIQPSRESMGTRAAALVAMAAPSGASARLVVTTPEAALQRILPVTAIEQGFMTLRTGQSLDMESVRDHLSAFGYLMDDRVDEPGEFALLGQGLDVYSPCAPQPYRILVEQGVVASIRSYDPVSQRSDDMADSVTLAPSTELPGQSMADADAGVGQSMESRMIAAGQPLSSVFELLPAAAITLAPGVDDRFHAAIALIDDARHTRDKQKGREPTPERFYLDGQALDAALKTRRTELDVHGLHATPDFILEVNPAKAAAEFIGEQVQSGRRIVLAGPASELDRLARTIGRRLQQNIGDAASWAQALQGKPGSIVRLDADIDGGFTDQASALALVCAADVFGARLDASNRAGATLAGDPELRIGDVVLHEDHGIAVLRTLESVDVDGAPTDVVRLEYHGGTTLLAPVEEFGRIWRYGSEEEAVTLDRLKGDGWAKRRAQLDIEIEDAAETLVRLAKEREQGGARVMKPPRSAYARFAAKFPYPETADQSAAIAAVIDDLASGRAMNRLICGDVGFGKTEVALRAAAIAALNGGQVAVVAPTTVLARQHFETFLHRFHDIEIALLSRVVSDAEARKVKAGLADGTVKIVIGTQAIAAKDIAFDDLALLIIDEEHRFGVKFKQQLRALAPRLHVLSMSATPIPRTLAAAMVGVQEASLLATPPARRRPVRTELAPFDRGSVKTALVREHRRAGQSFCVVPRIEDIEPVLAELTGMVPDLSVLVAHGGMDASEMDEAMVSFANGEGDILLSTNIIENGLDVPRANTIIVFRADRFGMAQLHQLRGRVGRGRAQGSAFLLTEPGQEISPETRSRLSTLLAFDRLGSGLAISSRDLDLRGAGDLVGEDQAGHVKLIGLGLYQHLLARAVEKARGNGRPSLEPNISLELSGAFPADYIPEPVVRLNLYSRLQRIETTAEIDAFADELEDRFGTPPAEAVMLIDLARLKLAAARAGIVKIGAGPVAMAIEFARPKSKAAARLQKRPDCTQSNGRLVFKVATSGGPERLREARKLVEACLSAKPVRQSRQRPKKREAR
jgi:transcription-repair coupling factor (superfamily II helicase)